MRYMDNVTNQYLDEVGRAEEIEEAYRASGQYDDDFEEWVSEQQSENPEEPCTMEDFDRSYALENYIEAWYENQLEQEAESLAEEEYDWRDE